MAEHKAEVSTEFLKADSLNRGVRTFLQGLGIDILVAIAITITATFETADGWGTLEWAVISFSFAKSILQAFASYVMRRFMDQSEKVNVAPTPPLPIKRGDIVPGSAH